MYAMKIQKRDQRPMKVSQRREDIFCWSFNGLEPGGSESE